MTPATSSTPSRRNGSTRNSRTPSTSSDASDPTTQRTSSSAQPPNGTAPPAPPTPEGTTTPATPPPRSASPRTGSLGSLRPSDRIFITGYTGSGKSHLARALFLAAPGPRLVIDPADSDLTAVPGAVTFTDPARPPAGADTARFVPLDPGDLDAYDRVYSWVFANFPRWVWADEAGDIAPAQRTKPAVRRVLSQGRKRQIGHLGCHTRPREVYPGMLANAQHLVCFGLPNPADREHVANACGIAPRKFDQLLTQIPEHGFAWFEQRTRRLMLCDPLPH